MTVDEVRRAWVRAAQTSEVKARLVAVGSPDSEGPTPMRGRVAGGWTERLRFEQELARELGDDAAAFDLQWLAPNPRSGPTPVDRARGKLGLAAKPRGPMEVGALAAKPTQERVDKAAATFQKNAVPGAKRILAVASGKGGVGKSTVAVNLALALKARGLAVGLLDADVYGPSMPTMLGSFSAPKRVDNVFQPPVAHGLPFLSLGLMVNPDQSVIWRGPMVQRMVRDMLQGTQWPELDVLIIDLPPGTGDVQLTLVQRALLSAALIVTTPQDIALIDAVRGLQMFRKMGVPVLGVVENMASWTCPSCGEADHPFGEGGGAREAKRLEVPFLASLPMDPAVREGGDSGKPAVLAAPEGPAAIAFAALADRVWGDLVALDDAPVQLS